MSVGGKSARTVTRTCCACCRQTSGRSEASPWVLWSTAWCCRTTACRSCCPSIPMMGQSLWSRGASRWGRGSSWRWDDAGSLLQNDLKVPAIEGSVQVGQGLFKKVRRCRFTSLEWFESTFHRGQRLGGAGTLHEGETMQVHFFRIIWMYMPSRAAYRLGRDSSWRWDDAGSLLQNDWNVPAVEGSIQMGQGLFMKVRQCRFTSLEWLKYTCHRGLPTYGAGTLHKGETMQVHFFRIIGMHLPSRAVSRWGKDSSWMWDDAGFHFFKMIEMYRPSRAASRWGRDSSWRWDDAGSLLQNGLNVPATEGSAQMGQGLFMKVRWHRFTSLYWLLCNWTVTVIQSGFEKGAEVLHQDEMTRGHLFRVFLVAPLLSLKVAPRWDRYSSWRWDGAGPVLQNASL